MKSFSFAQFRGQCMATTICYDYYEKDDNYVVVSGRDDAEMIKRAIKRRFDFENVLIDKIEDENSEYNNLFELKCL